MINQEKFYAFLREHNILDDVIHRLRKARDMGLKGWLNKYTGDPEDVFFFIFSWGDEHDKWINIDKLWQEQCESSQQKRSL